MYGRDHHPSVYHVIKLDCKPMVPIGGGEVCIVFGHGTTQLHRLPSNAGNRPTCENLGVHWRLILSTQPGWDTFVVRLIIEKQLLCLLNDRGYFRGERNQAESSSGGG